MESFASYPVMYCNRPHQEQQSPLPRLYSNFKGEECMPDVQNRDNSNSKQFFSNISHNSISSLCGSRLNEEHLIRAIIPDHMWNNPANCDPLLCQQTHYNSLHPRLQHLPEVTKLAATVNTESSQSWIMKENLPIYRQEPLIPNCNPITAAEQLNNFQLQKQNSRNQDSHQLTTSFCNTANSPVASVQNQSFNCTDFVRSAVSIFSDPPCQQPQSTVDFHDDWNLNEQKNLITSQTNLSHTRPLSSQTSPLLNQAPLPSSLNHTSRQRPVCKWLIDKTFDLPIPCNKAFESQSELITHWSRCHKQSAKLDQKKFVCKWENCKDIEIGKVYKQAYKLVLHMRVHTNELPYKCPYCGHKSRRNENHQAHVRTHTSKQVFYVCFDYNYSVSSVL